MNHWEISAWLAIGFGFVAGIRSVVATKHRDQQDAQIAVALAIAFAALWRTFA